MNIIGINAFHGDSSACLIIDGKIVSAVEEERFTRIKHWAGFPKMSIEFCLSNSNLKISDIDFISINRDNYANILRKIAYSVTKKPSLKLIIERIKNRKQWSSLDKLVKNNFPNDYFKGKIINVEHHLSHLSSAFHLSPFKNSCIISVDGFGDFTSTAFGFGSETKIKIDSKIFFPHSLGVFYEAITRYLGFKNYGDEYKVMGLAPYGRPNYLDKLNNLISLKKNGKFKLNLEYFLFHKTKQYETINNQIVTGQIFSDKLIELMGPPRNKDEEITQFHKDIASTAQKIYEETFFHSLNYLYEKYNNENICISGGCGMNSVANGKIRKNTKFKNIYIQSAAGDAGGALGSALITHYKHSKSNERFFMSHSYLGNEFTYDYIKKLCEKNNEFFKKETFKYKFYNNFNELTKSIANEISEGKVIGWFQDKMEWGPRALGNRSILGDPRNPKMKDILNLKIKRRESFRPFAPSIIREYVADWFETEDEVPFMMKVYQIKEDKRKLIPAVTHVDGSGRLQTVRKENNEKYYNLINEFYKITNIPILLNTSFNENEPIVCKPEEALNCFKRTKMDILVMGSFVISRSK